MEAFDGFIAVTQLAEKVNEDKSALITDSRISKTGLVGLKCKSYSKTRKKSLDIGGTSDDSEVVLTSPDSFSTSRYGRARRPRLIGDYYCSDEAISPLLHPNPMKFSPKTAKKPPKFRSKISTEAKQIKPVTMNTRVTLDVENCAGDVDSDYNSLLKIVSRPLASVSSASPPLKVPTLLKTYSRKKPVVKPFDLTYTDVLSELDSFSWTDRLPKSPELEESLKFEDEFTLPVESVNSIDVIDSIAFCEHTIEPPVNVNSRVVQSLHSDLQLDSVQNTLNVKYIKDASIKNTIQSNSSQAYSDVVSCKSEHTFSDFDNDSIGETHSNEDDSHWQLGDLIWSRVGNHPLWPCVVTLDPISAVFKKAKPVGRTYRVELHVRFFGDGGRRSWVPANTSLMFTGKKEFDKLVLSITKEVRRKDPKYASGFHIKPNSMKRWRDAVEEAESLLNKTVTERLNFFKYVTPIKKRNKLAQSTFLKSFNKFPLVQDNESDAKEKTEAFDKCSVKSDTSLINFATIAATAVTSTPKVKIQKLKHLHKNIEKQKLKITKVRHKSYPARNRQSVVRYDPTLLDDVQPAIIESLQLSREIELKLKDEKYETVENSDVRDIKSEPRSTPSPATIHSQTNKTKRKNLFKGVIKEKLCQVCEKPKNVFKCKGTCLRFYHYKCAKNPEKYSRKINYKVKVRNSIDADSSSDSKDSEPESEYLSDNDEAAPSVDDNKIPKDNKLKPALTLAEQIDAKMAEVMRNLGDEIKYMETSTEESGVDSDSNSISSQTKPMYHVTGDSSITSLATEETKISDEDFKCKDCLNSRTPECFVCGKYTSESNSEFRQKCVASQCGRVYHPECLRLWPQTQWTAVANSKNSKKSDEPQMSLMCPYHVCHTCVSDDPRGLKPRFSNEKLAKCIRCPTTYHASNFCIPAGSEILSINQIVCPKHFVYNHLNKNIFKRKSIHHVNASWCFICAIGGSLICCETCPTSFHAECLRINPPEGSFICEDCETGRLPLYNEIVWVKLGLYRWWPAQILFPTDIPHNIKSRKHNVGEFAVKFFGSHDFYWVNRGRVFLYQEGDTGHSSSRKSNVDGRFVKAIEEAAAAYKLIQGERASRAAESRPGMKPPSYIKIRSNRPVGNVRSGESHMSSMTPCDCNPDSIEPCGVDSDCLNRLLLTECNPSICPAGKKCCNQAFENRIYPQLTPFRTVARGWGLKTLEALVKGQFVIEYVGEMINEDEYKRRIKRMNEQKDENYYFLTIDKDRMLDAGPKGNVARFMNHSCQPNCETQKWTVNGDTRVGLFAVQDIPPETELTFNYNLESIGKGKKICRCGAALCSGFIGVKAKQEEPLRRGTKTEKPKKKKFVSAKLNYSKKSYACFMCGDFGSEGKCRNKLCLKTYHLACVGLEKWPKEQWLCPRHCCQLCSRRSKLKFCSKCVRSFCFKHEQGNVTESAPSEFVCNQHQVPSEISKPPTDIADLDLAEINSIPPPPVVSNVGKNIDEQFKDERTESPERSKEEQYLDKDTENKTKKLNTPKDHSPDKSSHKKITKLDKSKLSLSSKSKLKHEKNKSTNNLNRSTKVTENDGELLHTTNVLISSLLLDKKKSLEAEIQNNEVSDGSSSIISPKIESISVSQSAQKSVDKIKSDIPNVAENVQSKESSKPVKMKDDLDNELEFSHLFRTENGVSNRDKGAGEATGSIFGDVNISTSNPNRIETTTKRIRRRTKNDISNSEKSIEKSCSLSSFEETARSNSKQLSGENVKRNVIKVSSTISKKKAISNPEKSLETSCSLSSVEERDSSNSKQATGENVKQNAIKVSSSVTKKKPISGVTILNKNGKFREVDGSHILKLAKRNSHKNCNDINMKSAAKNVKLQLVKNDCDPVLQSKLETKLYDPVKNEGNVIHDEPKLKLKVKSPKTIEPKITKKQASADLDLTIVLTNVKKRGAGRPRKICSQVVLIDNKNVNSTTKEQKNGITLHRRFSKVKRDKSSYVNVSNTNDTKISDIEQDLVDINTSIITAPTMDIIAVALSPTNGINSESNISKSVIEPSNDPPTSTDVMPGKLKRSRRGTDSCTYTTNQPPVAEPEVDVPKILSKSKNDSRVMKPSRKSNTIINNSIERDNCTESIISTNVVRAKRRAASSIADRKNISELEDIPTISSSTSEFGVTTKTKRKRRLSRSVSSSSTLNHKTFTEGDAEKLRSSSAEGVLAITDVGMGKTTPKPIIRPGDNREVKTPVNKTNCTEGSAEINSNFKRTKRRNISTKGSDLSLKLTDITQIHKENTPSPSCNVPKKTLNTSKPKSRPSSPKSKVTEVRSTDADLNQNCTSTCDQKNLALQNPIRNKLGLPIGMKKKKRRRDELDLLMNRSKRCKTSVGASILSGICDLPPRTLRHSSKFEPSLSTDDEVKMLLTDGTTNGDKATSVPKDAMEAAPGALNGLSACSSSSLNMSDCHLPIRKRTGLRSMLNTLVPKTADS